jgi:hypothetical protein
LRVKAAAPNRVAGNIKAFASERGGLAARNNDFCNKIGTKRTYKRICSLAAFGSNADINRQLPDIAIYEYTP